ncbi:hypothetical protein [Methylosinus sp. PW1]|uniref:hypothetical protein n=1 Tax=Methylosinus sp. PW1 TaxID=107636 RepID=UPI000568E3BD|nr:hypothetical protein [Methylosinus sp. PW1]
MSKRSNELRLQALEFAKGSIVTQALGRLIEQVLEEVHATKVAPLIEENETLRQRIHVLEKALEDSGGDTR